ncbi:hypothetical protein ACE14D_10515 [Streptomyces sp. Act-28]
MPLSTCLCISAGEATFLPDSPSEILVPFEGKGSITLSSTPDPSVYTVLNHAQNGSFGAFGFEFSWNLRSNPAAPSTVTWAPPGPSIEKLSFRVIIEFYLSVTGSVSLGGCAKNNTPVVLTSSAPVGDPLNPPASTTFTNTEATTFFDCGTGTTPVFRIPPGFTITIPFCS